MRYPHPDLEMDESQSFGDKIGIEHQHKVFKVAHPKVHADK